MKEKAASIYMVMDEDTTVERAKRGDNNARGKLYEKYREKLFRVIYRTTGNREEALDMTQETFYKAFKKMELFRGESSFYTYILAIAMHLVQDDIRRKKLITVPLEIADFLGLHHTPNPTEEMDTNTRKTRIEKALSHLPTRQREVYVLRFSENRSLKECAQILNISEGAVKTHLHRAVKKLATLLKEKK